MLPIKLHMTSAAAILWMGELDGVMNYPYRKAIIDFLRQRDDGKGFRETIMTLAENYPPQVLTCCMNLLGTHDTPAFSPPS